jgi:hypothetical protein
VRDTTRPNQTQRTTNHIKKNTRECSEKNQNPAAMAQKNSTTAKKRGGSKARLNRKKIFDMLQILG